MLISNQSLQLLILLLCFDENRKIRIGVFP
jgi:hypothetical protein